MPLIDMSETYQMTNVGDHIDGTDVYQSNPNLLDNAYFVGGGSQLGDGHFPINQRGQTSYTAPGNIFDRWRNETQYASTILATDGLKFRSWNAGQWGTLVQQLAKSVVIAGKTVTISAIIDGTLASTTYSIPASGGYDLTPFSVGSVACNLYSPNGTDIQFRLYTTDGNAHTIAAAKLEFGTVSTLANDPPPDFGEELRKCQRYLFIRDYAQNDVIANGLTNNLTMFLPVSMRSGGSPTMTFTATPYVIGNGVISTPTSVNLASVNGNQVQIYAPTTESHNAQAIVLYAGSATRMTIVNEL